MRLRMAESIANAIGEIKRIRAAILAANAEVERPKAAGRLANPRIYPDSANECPAYRVEGINLAFHSAEIADQQSVGKLTKTRRRQSDAPRRGKFTAIDEHFLQNAALIENCHRSIPRRGS